MARLIALTISSRASAQRLQTRAGKYRVMHQSCGRPRRLTNLPDHRKAATKTVAQVNSTATHLIRSAQTFSRAVSAPRQATRAGKSPFSHGWPSSVTDITNRSPQDCSMNGCKGKFNLNDGKAYCSGNFLGCECASNPDTCGPPQSCDAGGCAGKFNGEHFQSPYVFAKSWWTDMIYRSRGVGDLHRLLQGLCLSSH
jgi:hypothetical protein